MSYVICLALCIYAVIVPRYERVVIAILCAYLLIVLIGKLSGSAT